MRISYSGRSGICDGEFWEEGDREEKPLRPRQESPAGGTTNPVSTFAQHAITTGMNRAPRQPSQKQFDEKESNEFAGRQWYWAARVQLLNVKDGIVGPKQSPLPT